MPNLQYLFYQGCNCSHNENEKAVEASAATEWSTHTVITAFQTESPGYQKMHRHSHWKGISGESGRRKGYLSLFGLKHLSIQILFIPSLLF